MKFVLEDNLKNRLISKISSMLCSKLDEHTDCFMPAKFNISVNLEEYDRSASKLLLKFTFVIVTDSRVVKYHIEGMVEIEGSVDHIKNVLTQHSSRKVPIVLYDIYQQVYPSIFTLSRIVDAPCPSPDMMHTNPIVTSSVDIVQENDLSDVTSPLLSVKTNMSSSIQENDLSDVTSKQISLAIEQSLRDISDTVCENVGDALYKKYNCYFHNCLEHPDYLADVLKQIFGDGHHSIVISINKRLEEFSYQKPIKEFLLVINK